MRSKQMELHVIRCLNEESRAAYVLILHGFEPARVLG